MLFLFNIIQSISGHRVYNTYSIILIIEKYNSNLYIIGYIEFSCDDTDATL